MPELHVIVYLLPIVFVAGFIDSVAGGGGLITVPAYLIAGFPPATLLGTNKCVSTMGTVVSASKYIHSGRILWPVAIIGIPCSLIGSVWGAHTVALLDASIVRKIILVALPLAAAITLIPKPHGHIETDIGWRSLRLWILIPIISFGLGWYDGFFGPGTGSLLIMLMYGIAGMSLIHAAAVGRLFNLVSNASALFTFMWHGQVWYKAALPLGIAGIAGHWCGSHLAIKRGHGMVRGMLVVTCGLLFAYLIWQQFKMPISPTNQ
ncbi:MAG: hypothetical protein COV45_02770 [Deltaproteobacteria bacterium CG11_big_fil_rev_8_21_14_0_20_47_16]|nr:MAG: hypothetical protein COV45_02770 [Deltaproteobacteria bacterium CG11_big_fil_rev_8_21_14_0_20_47_16]